MPGLDAPQKPGPAPKHDYEQLWLEYSLLKRTQKITMQTFADQKGIPRNTLRIPFARLKRESQLAALKRRNPELLLLAQRKMRDYLLEEADRTPQKNRGGIGASDQARLAVDVFKVIADREGLSPQANIISIQNSNTANAIVAPLFNEDSEEFKKLLGAP